MAQNNTNRRSAIDERNTRHAGYGVSFSKRWFAEKPFAWMKQIGGPKGEAARLNHVEWLFVFGCAAYNPLRIPKLRGQCAVRCWRAFRDGTKEPKVLAGPLSPTENPAN